MYHFLLSLIFVHFSIVVIRILTASLQILKRVISGYVRIRFITIRTVTSVT